MLDQAFNSLLKIHSRAATLKRFGTPNVYSPISIAPSNYFRFLAGPSATTIHGREFVIPVASMKGQQRQRIKLTPIPTLGTFVLRYGGDDTTAFNFDVTASEIENALQLITGLENVNVILDVSDGYVFEIRFIGVDAPELIQLIPDGTFNGVAEITIGAGIPFDPLIKRGDKIVDSIHGSMAVDEIIEMVDLGGAVIGYRVRAE